jgi:hypothetical protein
MPYDSFNRLEGIEGGRLWFGDDLLFRRDRRRGSKRKPALGNAYQTDRFGFRRFDIPADAHKPVGRQAYFRAAVCGLVFVAAGYGIPEAL